MIVSEYMRLVFTIKNGGGTQSYNRNFSRNSMLKKRKMPEKLFRIEIAKEVLMDFLQRIYYSCYLDRWTLDLPLISNGLLYADRKRLRRIMIDKRKLSCTNNQKILRVYPRAINHRSLIAWVSDGYICCRI